MTLVIVTSIMCEIKYLFYSNTSVVGKPTYIIFVVSYAILLLDFVTLSRVQFRFCSILILSISIIYIVFVFAFFIFKKASACLCCASQCTYLPFSYIFINAVAIHIQYCLRPPLNCIQSFVFNHYIQYLLLLFMRSFIIFIQCLSFDILYCHSHLFVHNIFFILVFDYHSLGLLTLMELIAKSSTLVNQLF